MKTWMAIILAGGLTLAVGCDSGSTATKSPDLEKAKKAGEEAVQKAGEAMEKGKDTIEKANAGDVEGAKKAAGETAEKGKEVVEAGQEAVEAATGTGEKPVAEGDATTTEEESK